ncbi:MAG TPA: ABC transporter substrate-binding protein [Gaiellaceae bacterium]|jgi:ABC-type branched-subunit amino acid transport system substrate-binding protein
MGRVSPPAALVVLFSLVLTGAASADTPGVTSSRILVGSSGPLTGAAAASSDSLRGAAAYFRYVNARGGVHGRKIELVYLDDASSPVRARLNAHRLIADNGVFALFSVVGTNANLAIRGIANGARVPQVFSSSGATTLGRDARRYPWTIGYPPAFSAEGGVYARNILATRTARTKVAVLYQSDASGRDLVGGFRRALGAGGRRLIVKSIGYDPAGTDVPAQVARLKASGATTFCIFAFGRFAIQAVVSADRLGWHPRIYLSNVAAAASTMRLDPQRTAEGSVSILWAKDPSAPRFANDAGVRLAGRIVAAYLPGLTPDSYVLGGMAAAYSFVDALRAAGKDLTRDGLMGAVTHLTETSNPFLAPGIAVRTTPGWRFPIAEVRLQRWHRGHWVPFGPVLSARP